MRSLIFIKSLTHFFFTKECVVCNEELLSHERHICLSCHAGLPFTHFWNYRKNSAEINFWGKVRIERVISLFYYTGSYNKLLYSIKYRSNVKLCKYLGEMLGEKIVSASIAEGIVYDYIVPVPLHYLKKWKRGFNQSYIIAQSICKIINKNSAVNISNSSKGGDKNGKGKCRVVNILERVHFTKTQTHKDKTDRWKSVEHAFALKKPNFLLRTFKKSEANALINMDGSNILLIDDVLTTGATLEACANTILKQYRCKISIATLAYVE